MESNITFKQNIKIVQETHTNTNQETNNLSSAGKKKRKQPAKYQTIASVSF